MTRHIDRLAPQAQAFDYFPEVDAQAMADYEAFYPWAYPNDAGFVTAWPSTVENPDPMMDWPFHYDPYAVGAPVVVEGPPPDHMAGDLRAVIPESLWNAGRQAGEGLGHVLGQGIEGLGQAFGQTPLGVPTRIERKVGEVGDKTADAADTVKTQANQVGDDARRTMAMMQATMVAANRHLEDTSKKAQATTEMIKYVVVGIGALATVALLFHIVKQSSE